MKVRNIFVVIVFVNITIFSVIIMMIIIMMMMKMMMMIIIITIIIIIIIIVVLVLVIDDDGGGVITFIDVINICNKNVLLRKTTNGKICIFSIEQN